MGAPLALQQQLNKIKVFKNAEMYKDGAYIIVFNLWAAVFDYI